MSAPMPKALDGLSIIEWAYVPFHERVADQMANVLFEADQLLQMLETEGDTPLAWLEPDIRTVYERVNVLLHKISD